MKLFKPTEEQKFIADIVKKHNKIKVNAFAGTGKTATIQLIAEEMPQARFLYLAFNKAAAESAKQKFPKNVHISTIHGLAYKEMIISGLIKGAPRGELKPKEIIEAIDLDKYVSKIKNISLYSYAWLISSILSNYFNSDYAELTHDTIKKIVNYDEHIKHSIFIFKIDLEDILSATKEILVFMEKNNIITHNYYLKQFDIALREAKVAEKVFSKFNVVALDEAQDTNPVSLSIFNKYMGKKIMVGDKHQQIYSWRGSMNAMEKFDYDVEGYLTLSFRVSKVIAEKATHVLKNYKFEDKILNSAQSEKPKGIKSTCYISRTNSGIVESIISIKDKIRNWITLRDPNEIFRVPLTVYDIINYTRSDGPKAPWLMGLTADNIKEYADDAVDYEVEGAYRLAMKYDIPELYNIASKKYNKNKSKTPVVLSTAHTSKGLEWDKVVILDDFADIPGAFIRSNIFSVEDFGVALKAENTEAIAISEEINTYYVALTRAKYEINDLSNTYLDMDMESFKEEMEKRKESFEAIKHSFDS